MTSSVKVGLLVVLAAAPLVAQEPSPGPSRAPVAIQSVSADGVTVFFQNVPWGPQTFATMESASDSFYNKRTWPFARLETQLALTLDGTRLAPGNYALVFHPAGVERPAMSLELLKIAPGEFFQSGNPMTRTPQGESVFRAPVAFDKAAETVAALRLTLAAESGALTLGVAYGDRRLSRTFKR